MGERYQAMAEYYRRAELEQARQAAGAFDWLDAGIGALAAIGAFALLGLGALRDPLARRAIGEPSRVVADDATREGGCHTPSRSISAVARLNAQGARRRGT